MLVLLGNINPNGLDEPSITRVLFPDDRTSDEILAEIKDLWTKAHSAGDAPEWVEADDERVAHAIAFALSDPEVVEMPEPGVPDAVVAKVPFTEVYGRAPVQTAVGRPADWKSLGDHWTLENRADLGAA